MDWIARFLIDRTKGIVGAVAVFFAANILLVAHWSPTGLCSRSLITSLEMNSSFLMTLESPRQFALSGLPNILTVTCWLVSFLGWLLIPLLIGSLITHAYTIRTLELDLELAVTNHGIRLGLTGERLKEFVRKGLAYIRQSDTKD
jgi:hypothetical protein